MLTKIVVNKAGDPIRADILLANAYPNYSRAALAKLFNIGQVTKKLKPIKAGDKIKPGDSLLADISELQKPVEKIDLPIIYEDANIVVIDKPTGVISHARGRYWNEASVASFVRDKLTGLTGERAGIVHRLDRATSGVMICAKNVETLKFLQKQFSLRKTKKVYYAVIQGTIKPDTAIIDVPLARNPKKPQTFMVSTAGKNAVTIYKVLKTNQKYSLIELCPQTGRTHQLRVHTKYIQHPIIGDELYGGQPANRLFLHAYSLEINLPSGERSVFTSPLPQLFNNFLQ